MLKIDQDQQMPLSRILFILTVHRRIRGEILHRFWRRNFNGFSRYVVLFFSLLRSDSYLRSAARILSDELYDLEFWEYPSIERRVFACQSEMSALIRWIDIQEEAGQELENLTF